MQSLMEFYSIGQQHLHFILISLKFIKYYKIYVLLPNVKEFATSFYLT